MKLHKVIFSGLAAMLAASCAMPFPDFIESAPGWIIETETLDEARSNAYLTCDGITPAVSKKNGIITCTYEKVGGKDITLSISYAKEKSGKALEIRPTVTNNEKGIFVKSYISTEYKLESSLESNELLMPRGPGMKVTGIPDQETPGAWRWVKEDNCFQIGGTYPSMDFSMQWMALAGKESGLYVGSHDPNFTGKKMVFRYYPENKELHFKVKNQLCLFPGETVEVAPLMFYSYEGSWHKAADTYREYFLANRTIIDSPDWIRNSTGWMLTILKQQNEEIMWPYNTIGKELTKVADDRGLDIIGLFGWATGGHDRFYPDYVPDPDMGGVEGVKAGIAEAKAKGKRIIIYANGQLIDQNGTEFWGDTGQHIAVKLKNDKIWHQTWHKYYDAPSRTHGMACHSSQVWKQRLLNLALQANSIGADGILYDQLATGCAEYCYSPEHGHRVPSLTYERDKYQTLEYIRDYMKKVNPDFVVMTEGITDCEMNTISMFHGCGYAFGVIWPNVADAMMNGSIKGAFFPQMFKYTFPEWTSTDRNPAPANTRATLNNGVAFGMRNELESRYAGDVKYLLDGTIPVPEDYGNVISKPDLRILQTQDAEAIKVYSKQVLDFLRSNADILYRGRYMDTKGFSIESSEPCIATAFTKDNRMGIVVWNISDEKALSYSLDVPGYKQVSVSAPDKAVSAGDSIAPQSIHYIIFEK